MNNIKPNIEQSPLEIEMLYHHSDFIIVYKPEEVSFHNEGDITGFFNLAKSYFKIPLWPVHRLDKLTSGILILAKSAKAAKQFGILFDNKKIEKTYLAISDKKPKKKQGKIIGDMKKSRNGSWMLEKNKTNPARTQFKSFLLIPKLRLFVVQPMTGKTHQIRVALKSLGSPILGDSRYGGCQSDRAYLHSYKIKFSWNEEVIECSQMPTEGKLFQLPKVRDILK